MLRSRLVAAALSIVFVCALSFGLYAAGAGAPVRGIPYTGYLMDSGAAVSVDVPMTFRIFDDPSAGAQLWTDDYPSVTVSAGRFSVVLGEDVALGDAVFHAAELWLEIDIDGVALAGRQQIWAAAQAVRAARAGDLAVTGDLTVSGHAEVAGDLGLAGGQVWQGTAHTSNGTDLGLYSGTASKFVRVVSNSGRVNIYNDGDYGTTPDLSVQPAFTHVRGELEVGGDLDVNGDAFGGWVELAAGTHAGGFDQTWTAATNGFVVAEITAAGNGNRCWFNLYVDGVVRARDGVHDYTTSDTRVNDGSGMVPVGKDSAYRVRHGNSSGTCVFNAWWVPFAP
jgi:hypothetical protein